MRLTDHAYEASWNLAADPEAVSKARQLAREALDAWSLAELADDCVLIVSELVTNAVVHGAAPITLDLHRYGPVVRGQVTDHGTWQPPLANRADALDEHGRGLFLVNAYAHRWGMDPTQCGTAVWFLLGAP